MVAAYYWIEAEMKLLLASGILAAAILAHSYLSRERYEAYVTSRDSFLLIETSSGKARVCLMDTTIGQVRGCSIGYPSAQN